MMVTIPQAILQRFELLLKQDNIPVNRHNFFKKWLKYYLDFCHKYEHDPQNIDSLSLFINKLRTKNNQNSSRNRPMILF